MSVSGSGLLFVRSRPRSWGQALILLLSISVFRNEGSALAVQAREGKSAESGKAYSPSAEDFPNPERGVLFFIKLPEAENFKAIREKGITLVYAGISLADFRSEPISGAFLEKLGQGFQAVREAGLKVVLRFQYSSKMGQPDAEKAWILRHLEQLKPSLEKNSDVIAVLQAGFIGAWGEWHDSTHGLDNPEDRREILGAILSALPRSRAVQVRTPHFKAESFGGPLEAPEAYSGSPRARIGHHNDAFQAGEDDMGTYRDPVDRWKEWVASDGWFVPVGGEPAGRNDRASGQEVLSALARFHWSFLHLRYPKAVLERWQNEGLLAEIRKRLGYRFRLLEASWTDPVRPGGELSLTFRLKNEGFASLYNNRPLEVTLTGGESRFTARLRSIDPRRWEPGRESKLELKLSVPANAPPGNYRLSLRLPDEAPGLARRADYAVRFANERVWDPASGENILTEGLRLDPSAQGAFNPGVREFAELPR